MTNRRDLLKVAAGFPHILRAARSADRPNMLFLFADDWARYAGVYRNPKRPSFNDVVKTPNVDRVAHEGVCFTNAFMATPSCTPSRAAVATGCYSWRAGSAANLRGGSWKGKPNPADELPGFGRLLESKGYLVRNSYKTLSPNWLGGKTYEKRNFQRFSQYVSAASTPAEARKRRDEFVDQARQGIRSVLKERKPGQPFYYIFGPIHTHRPWVWESGTKLWGIDPDALKGKLHKFLPDNSVVRQDVADYLGEVQALDLMVGCFLEELEKARELDKTMLVLSGDNGMGGMPRGKCNLYDFGVQAPLMIRWAGRARARRTVDDFVNLMDLAPTFLEAAGIAPPETMNGRSLVPLLTSSRSGLIDPARDFVMTSRERHVQDARQGNLPYPSRAIRTRDYLYIRNFKPDRWPMGDPIGLSGSGPEPSYEELAKDTMVTFKDHDASPTKAWMVTHRNDPEVKPLYELGFGKRPAEELYDSRKDPDQLRNIASDPAYTAQKRQLSGRLMKIMQDSRDPRLQDAFDRPPYIEEI